MICPGVTKAGSARKLRPTDARVGIGVAEGGGVVAGGVTVPRGTSVGTGVALGGGEPTAVGSGVGGGKGESKVEGVTELVPAGAWRYDFRLPAATGWPKTSAQMTSRYSS